jgi:phosphoribosylformylglycinamidine (FGAM) synthase-like enzyme
VIQLLRPISRAVSPLKRDVHLTETEPNPEWYQKGMGEVVACIEGIGEAAGAIDFPVVSGNV